jgi:hypothetical protein
VLRSWPRRHVLVATWAGIGLAAAILWLGVALWQFFHPADLPSLLADTVPAVLAAVAGLAGLVAGIIGLVFSARRARFLAIVLVAAAGLAAPVAVFGVAWETLNDWNFANRAFITALFPFVAAELNGDLPRVTTTDHYVIHHSRPLPDWEVERLEIQWSALQGELGTEPAGRIELYLDDAGTMRQRLGGNGATYGRLVFTRPMTAPDDCETSLHEIAHSFMYTRRAAYTMPQLLDEGWARAHQGCSIQQLDQDVVLVTKLGYMVPLEDRLGAGAFSSARYGGLGPAYAVAGSFVEYLIRTDGIGPFLKLVDTTGVENTPATAEAVYGMPFSQLEAAWLADVSQRTGVPLQFATASG